ncbi:MAG: hypothetical protein IPM17_10530 [Verrucomicrobia bacterium]|jgi:hypothetical protein|nr:hypothetical protein [Verrucomicrobiota bacterium]
MLRSLGLAVGLAATTGARSEEPAAASPVDVFPPLPVWDATFNVRGGGGYKDNVLLSAAAPDASSFLLAGLDLFVFRLPVGGTEFSAMVTGDFRRYLETPEAEKEQSVFVGFDVKQALGAGWKAGGAAQYFYFDQVFDASTTEDPELGIVKAVGHNVTVRPNVTRQFGAGTSIVLEGLAGWQFYEQPLDSHQDFGGRLTLRHETPWRAAFETWYEFDRRPYETRNETTATGVAIPGSRLTYQYHRLEGGWRQKWDAAGRWRTALRAGAEFNRDSGAGYYDYTRLLGSAQVRYVRDRWEVQASLRLNRYDYDVQTTNFDNPELRHKSTLVAGARAQWEFVKRLRAFAEFEREQSEGNDPADRYSANTVFAGFEYEF